MTPKLGYLLSYIAQNHFFFILERTVPLSSQRVSPLSAIMLKAKLYLSKLLLSIAATIGSSWLLKEPKN